VEKTITLYTCCIKYYFKSGNDPEQGDYKKKLRTCEKFMKKKIHVDILILNALEILKIPVCYLIIRSSFKVVLFAVSVCSYFHKVNEKI
jgi:hypothetical protein